MTDPVSPRGANSRADDYRRRTLRPVRSQKFCTTPTLVSLLEDPAVLDSFGDHLDASLQSENLDFWLEVAVFRTLNPAGDQARMLALRIWNRYLSPSAPEQVNVPGHLIEQVEAGLRRPELDGLFEACFDHVQNLLESECIPRFIKRNLALRVLTGRVGGRAINRKTPVLLWLEARLIATHGLDSRGLPLPPFTAIQWLPDEPEAILLRLHHDNETIESPRFRSFSQQSSLHHAAAASFASSSSSSARSLSPPPASSSVPAGLPSDFLSGPSGLPFDMPGEDDGIPVPSSYGSSPPSAKKSSGRRLGKSAKESKASKAPKESKVKKVKASKTKGSSSADGGTQWVFSMPRRGYVVTSFRGQACFQLNKQSDFTMPNYLQGIERLLSQTSQLTDRLEARASAMLEACLDEELELTPDVHSFKYALAALRSVANPILAEILVRSYLLNHCSCRSRSELVRQPVAGLLRHVHAESSSWPVGQSELVDTWRACFASGATIAAVAEQERQTSPTRTDGGGEASSSTDVARARVLPLPTALIESSAIGLRRAITLVPDQAQRNLLTQLLQASDSPSVY